MNQTHLNWECQIIALRKSSRTNFQEDGGCDEKSNYQPNRLSEERFSIITTTMCSMSFSAIYYLKINMSFLRAIQLDFLRA
jgi:hypothetical protein